MPLTAEKGSLYDLAVQGVLPPSVISELYLVKSAGAGGTWNSKLQRPSSFHRLRSWFKTRSLTLYDSGVDFSGTIGSGTASCLKANRGGFVCVYIKWTGRGSIEMYRSVGLRVVPIYETTGTDYRGGFGAGVNAANAFLAWCNANGYQGAEVYFTFDEDVMGLGLSGLAVAYARGWNSVIGVGRCNAYGSSGLITVLLNAGVIKRGWVTYAWSGGALDPRATLYQNPNNTSWCGLSTDNDRAFQPTIGSIGEVAPPPPIPVVKRGKKVWLLSLPNGSVYVTDGITFRWLNGVDEENVVKYAIVASGGTVFQGQVDTWQKIGVPADKRSADAAGATWPPYTQ